MLHLLVSHPNANPDQQDHQHPEPAAATSRLGAPWQSGRRIWRAIVGQCLWYCCGICALAGPRVQHRTWLDAQLTTHAGRQRAGKCHLTGVVEFTSLQSLQLANRYFENRRKGLNLDTRRQSRLLQHDPARHISGYLYSVALGEIHGVVV